jgi:hypothetical protein
VEVVRQEQIMLRALTALAGVTAYALAANAAGMRIVIDEAEILTLTRPAASIIIGNPSVAGVSVENPTTLVVTGRSYGLTNLMVLDGHGRAIFSGDVVVADRSNGVLTLVRGNQNGQRTFVCAPRCTPMPDIGDDQEQFEKLQTQTAGRAAAAKAGQ